MCAGVLASNSRSIAMPRGGGFVALSGCGIMGEYEHALGGRRRAAASSGRGLWTLRPTLVSDRLGKRRRERGGG